MWELKNKLLVKLISVIALLSLVGSLILGIILFLTYTPEEEFLFPNETQTAENLLLSVGNDLENTLKHINVDVVSLTKKIEQLEVENKQLRLQSENALNFDRLILTPIVNEDIELDPILDWFPPKEFIPFDPPLNISDVDVYTLPSTILNNTPSNNSTPVASPI